MGALTLPGGGLVYVDTQILIYTVERHPAYEPVLRPLWEAAQDGDVEAVSSDLTLMETLVSPLRSGDAALQADYERALLGTDLRLLPLTQVVLREAARLRASIPGLRTPDALHAATALLSGCALFVTNDRGFRRVAGLPLVLLDDVLAS